MSALSALSAVVADGGFGDGHMGGGWGWLVISIMVVLMGGLGWMILVMTRGRADETSTGNSSHDPVDVLRTRYARGELTTEEFQERLQTLEADARR